MRIGIAVPTLDEVKADFWLSWSWLMIDVAKSDLEVVVLNCRTSLITNSRYQLVKEALKLECGKVFFVDSDLTFPADCLRRLLSWDKPIVGATYVRRREPYGILGYGIEDIPLGATGLWRMARLPAGMLLVDSTVFDRVSKPWFIDEWKPETGEFESEDYVFCDRARVAGYDIFCDLDLSRDLGHLGQQVFTWGRESR